MLIKLMIVFTRPDGLYFVNTSTSQHLILGEDSPINCEVRGNLNQLNYGWDKEELSIDNDNIKYELTGDGPLIVRNVSNDDAGIYKCSATEIDGIGNIIEQEITVEVLVKPVISEIRASPGNVVLAGSNVTIQCLAEGTPHPEFFWKKVADKANDIGPTSTAEHAEMNRFIMEKLVAAPVLSAGAIIGLSIVVVFLLLLLFDLLLLCWRRQGVIATCYFKKNKEKNENLQSRDKKGLLVKEGEARPDDSLTRPNNGHREFEYNKTTGVITGKHSTV
ncbi:hypothetical protein MSG28_004736 [Choristoneura fumiferana]|uniref:Uncharacterized protein n=1 Tax=Choristoneura fumiferana TaxID=7141 RepID=A0ACC0K8G1_CHOFU|nr:hypothetical protein MSG28_004736 [Choristoneura fumiferana]